MAEPLPLSVVIVAKNEAHNLVRCLDSVRRWTADILVVLNDTTDTSETVALGAGARVKHLPWQGYRDTKNAAVALAKHDWVLSLDADEEVSPALRADLVAGYIELTVPEKQGLLETLSVEERLRRVLVHVQRQIGLLEAQEDIKSQVQEELGERQREMFLREQLKAIQKELGDLNEGGEDELSEMERRIQAAGMPVDARKKVDADLKKVTDRIKAMIEGLSA